MVCTILFFGVRAKLEEPSWPERKRNEQYGLVYYKHRMYDWFYNTGDWFYNTGGLPALTKIFWRWPFR